MKHIYLAYLHYCGFSQKDLVRIFASGIENPESVFENIWWFDFTGYKISGGRKSKILERFAKASASWVFTKMRDSFLKNEVELISLLDTEYPQEFQHLSNPPFLIYVRGKIRAWQRLAVVGSRKMSEYGEKVWEQIIPDLSKSFTIVSWGAAGCDALAHRMCLQVWGRTLCVLGTGINKVYPHSHKSLFEEIVASWWALISIFPFDEPGNPYNFPIRNELVVALSRWVLLLEAQGKSGSLITANLALEHGKDVFAIPWDIARESSKGCNQLIASGGAQLVMSAEDVFSYYSLEYSDMSEKLPDLSPLQEQMYISIQQKTQSIDSLSEFLWVSDAELLWELSYLELLGCVSRDSLGNYYTIK